MNAPIYTPPSGPPQASAPQLYLQIGSDNLYLLSSIVYQRLGRSAIAHLFPAGEALEAASRKQAEFLIGVLGGPPVFREKHGPPRMRARHFPFAIDTAARDEWLRCFRAGLGDGAAYGLSASETAELVAWLEAFSAWMVNRA